MRSLPRDRFAGLRPIDQIGQVTLDPIEISADSKLTINGSAQGSIQVEILTAEGYRVPRFTKQDSVPINGDSLRHAVGWNNETTQGLPEGRYQLRFYLDNAELFALNIENPNEH
jgi:hypothetical protein